MTPNKQRGDDPLLAFEWSGCANGACIRGILNDDVKTTSTTTDTNNSGHDRIKSARLSHIKLCSGFHVGASTSAAVDEIMTVMTPPHVTNMEPSSLLEDAARSIHPRIWEDGRVQHLFISLFVRASYPLPSRGDFIHASCIYTYMFCKRWATCLEPSDIRRLFHPKSRYSYRVCAPRAGPRKRVDLRSKIWGGAT